jgi:O-antigen/teichoic acid export membrane protein
MRRVLIDRIIALLRGPIAQASIASLGIRGAGLIMAFGSAVLAGRLLGAEGYGQVAYVLAFSQILAVLSVFGFGQLSVRVLSNLMAQGIPSAAKSFMRFSASTTAALSLLSAATLSLAAAFLTDGETTRNFFLGALLVPPLAFLILMRGAALGLGKVIVAQVPGDIIRPTLLALLFGGLAIVGGIANPSGYLFSALVAVSASSLLAGTLVYFAVSHVVREAASKGTKGKWLVEASAFFGLGIVSILQGEINTILLALLAGPAEAGLYQPVLRLLPVIGLAGQVVQVRFETRVSEAWSSRDTRTIQDLGRKVAIATTAMTSLIVLAIGLSGPWIMRIFGPDFASSAPLLWIIGAAVLFDCACGPSSAILSMTENTKETLMGVILALGLNISLGFVIIPDYGALGASLALALAIVTWNIYQLWRVKSLLGLSVSLPDALFSIVRSRMHGNRR